MKFWKCPECKRVRYKYNHTIMRICPGCNIEMEVFEDDCSD